MTKTVIMDKATSAKNVHSLVSLAIKSATGFKDAVQSAGLAIMAHASGVGEGDVSGTKELCRAVPKRMRNDLINWFRTYSPIGVNIDVRDASKDRDGYVAKSKRNPFDIEAAAANPWYDFRNAQSDSEPASLKTLTGFWDDILGTIERKAKQLDNDGANGTSPKYDPAEREVMEAELEEIRSILNKEKARSIKAVYSSKPEKAAEPEVEAAHA